jgi:hypothetical protein
LVAPVVVRVTAFAPLSVKDALATPKLLIVLAFASNPLFTEKLLLVAI